MPSIVPGVEIQANSSDRVSHAEGSVGESCYCPAAKKHVCMQFACSIASMQGIKLNYWVALVMC